MQCDDCKIQLIATDYAVISNKHYCFQCLPKHLSTVSSNEQTSSQKLSTKHCQVCYDDKPEQDFKTKHNSQCRHIERSICDGCVHQHVVQAFEKMCTDDVYCPELNCGSRFNYETVIKILSDNKDRMFLEKYEQFVLHRTLERMREFIWCAHGCGMGQLNEGLDKNNIVQCVKCQRKTCFIHKIEWHDGLTCSEFDATSNPELQASESWISQNCKKCPKCHCIIEKADGCDHMTCGKCRYEFCWSCLAAYDLIRKNGNHYHESTCKHYAAYRD